ncbi:gluconeogenesis factor YvcK family protein [Calidifontibacillus erzurumensis]|uniref:gluconeogenesis factor YvcK family protein n=1 Tax=Calidifontibacillus erzurumensis TaxID=2741433 RepID=UPI002E75AB3A|nr:YvcK family protein [Calidifontibacillus erzurumensis]
MDLKKLPKIIVIGGGTGLPVLLRGLKNYPLDITAIVTVADDGGSSGRLRNDLQIPPPGDIRNVLAALSEVEPLIVRLFQHRFQNGSELSGHALGNLLLAAMTNITGDFVSGIREMSKVLNVKGKVLPAANRGIILHAELEDGSIVTGESKIPNANKKIKRVFLSPHNVEPLPESLEEIAQADLIVIAPGSLYTSILPNLLVKKIGEQLCRSKAKKIYVCNIMTQPGETMGFSASDHVKALYDHLQCNFLDYIIVNDADLPKEILKRYALQNAEPVRYDVEKLKTFGLQIINEDLVQIQQGVIRHDTRKIARVIYSLL